MNQTEQLLAHCHLCRRNNQLKIDKIEIRKARQRLMRLEAEYESKVLTFNADHRAYWLRFEQKKRVITLGSPRAVTPLAQLLKESGLSVSDFHEMLMEETKLNG